LPKYSVDNYNVVYNSTETFDATAEHIKKFGSVCLHWTDQGGSLLNILLAKPQYVGGALDVFPLAVAVMGCGAYTFTDPVATGYLAEKLRVRSLPTLDKLAELINGVLSRMDLTDDQRN